MTEALNTPESRNEAAEEIERWLRRSWKSISNGGSACISNTVLSAQHAGTYEE
jgi:hypothetical protein